VARGFTQRQGVDFTESTSLIVALTSLRSLLAIATALDMGMKQLDVDSAFLYGNLSKEIYLKEIEGFQIDRANRKKLICKL
jgi:N12 class adenine-specific DNA methylase